MVVLAGFLISAGLFVGGVIVGRSFDDTRTVIVQHRKERPEKCSPQHGPIDWKCLMEKP